MHPGPCRGPGTPPGSRPSAAAGCRLAAVLLVGLALGYGGAPLLSPAPRTRAADAAPASAPLLLHGATQPAPGHSAAIAPQVLQPVHEVLVQPGDRVRKDQALIRLDDDQARITVQMKKEDLQELRAELARLKQQPRQNEIGEVQAELEKARIGTEDARKRLDRMEQLYQKGAVPERGYQSALTDFRQAQKEEQAARDRLAQVEKRPIGEKIAAQEARIRSAEKDLALAQANLDDLTITARVAGVVSRLDVCPGTVVRPGTATWGEILDLSVLDVRCAATPEQARGLKRGQTAEVRENGEAVARGEVVLVGLAADPTTRQVPVLVRVPNREERLRCYVPVDVTFPAGGH